MARLAIACIDAAAATTVLQDDPSAGSVQIRVGLHSGPTTAVVIGTKSPKYTLLGDTINTARWVALPVTLLCFCVLLERGQTRNIVLGGLFASACECMCLSLRLCEEGWGG
jgi:hypothetical protein